MSSSPDSLTPQATLPPNLASSATQRSESLPPLRAVGLHAEHELYRVQDNSEVAHEAHQLLPTPARTYDTISHSHHLHHRPHLAPQHSAGRPPRAPHPHQQRSHSVPLRSTSHPTRPVAAPVGAPMQDPERNVKRAAAHEYARSAFYHGTYTSSHGAMMLRQTPRLAPASPTFDPRTRARRRALELMPPAMRQRYLQAEGGPPATGRPPRLLIQRSPATRVAPGSFALPSGSLETESATGSGGAAARSQQQPPRSVSAGRRTPLGTFFLPIAVHGTSSMRRGPSPAMSQAETVRSVSRGGRQASYQLDMTMSEDQRLEAEDEELEEEEEEDEEAVEDEEVVSWTDALLELLPLALPAMITMALTFGLSAIPLAFIGSHLGEDKLAGASVGYFIISIVAQYPICGLTFALDTLVSHEFGRDPTSDVMGVLLQRGILVNLAFLVPICVALRLWLPTLLALIYGDAIAQVAAAYLYYIPLFLTPLVIFTAFSKFCSNQMLPQLPMIAMAIGLAVTPVAQKILIPIGVEGAMLGMAVAATVQLVVLMGLTFAKKETRASFGSIRIREALDWDDVVLYLKLALPSALFVAAEASAFDMTVLLAARLGQSEGAAWSAVLNSCLPFVSVAGGLSTAACAKVGASLGAGYPEDARRYAFAAVGGSAIGSAFNSIVIVTFFDFWLHLFGCDGDALAIGRSLLPIIPAMHMGDSIQFAFQGVFSGAGQNHRGAMILLSSLWAIGFPLAIFLAFYADWGVAGVVWGLTIGLLVETPSMMFSLYRLDWQMLAEDAQAEAMEDEEDEELEEEEEEEEEEESEEEMQEMDHHNAPTTAIEVKKKPRQTKRRGRSSTRKHISI